MKNGIENGVNTIEVTLATRNMVLSAMICSLSLSTLLFITSYLLQNLNSHFHVTSSYHFRSLATGMFSC